MSMADVGIGEGEITFVGVIVGAETTGGLRIRKLIKLKKTKTIIIIARIKRRRSFGSLGMVNFLLGAEAVVEVETSGLIGFS